MQFDHYEITCCMENDVVPDQLASSKADLNIHCFYAPNFKKLKGHIALGLSVLPFVHPLQNLSYSFEVHRFVIKN